MDSLLKDEIFLAPTIFLTSPQVNNSLFAEVSTDSFCVVSTQVFDDSPLVDASQSSLSPEFESESDLFDAMYTNLIHKQYEAPQELSESYDAKVKISPVHKEHTLNNVSNETINVLGDSNYQYLSESEWDANFSQHHNDSEPLPNKNKSFDSLDNLLSRIADSVIATKRRGGTLSTIESDDTITEEHRRVHQKTISQESMEETASDNIGTHDTNLNVQQNEVDITEKSPLARMFFNEISSSQIPMQNSKEASERELLLVFDELNKKPQNSKALPACSSLIKSLEANYYIKSESGYHLPTKALAYLKNEDYSVHYNPYYTFLPEFIPKSKHEQPATPLKIDLKQMLAKKMNDLKPAPWIKSCEFQQKKYPQDPLRFLSYVKSNNVGGDRRASLENQYNPYYTFFPHLDKGALNEAEPRTCAEEINEIVQQVTDYKQAGDADTIIYRAEIKNSAHKEIKDVPHEGIRLQKILESPENLITSQTKEREKKKENIAKTDEKDNSKTAENVIKQCFSELPTPIVTVIPPNAIRETISGSSKHLVAVISHLFRDTMPEPIVHESPSSHSNHEPENRESEQTTTVTHTIEDSASSTPLLSEVENTFDNPAPNELEPSAWKDIGWPSIEKLIEDSDIDLHDTLAGFTDELSEMVWQSTNRSQCDINKDQTISSPPSTQTWAQSTLEPPKDFGTRSNSVTMSSLYEHPHRHKEIPPELLNALSSNALLRYQYVGCPLCSSSSTVVDEKELERLVAESKPTGSFNSAPASGKSQRGSPKMAEGHPPAKKTLTIAGQLLHPQVDAYIAARTRERNAEESGYKAGEGNTVAPSPRGILANVRLAAGGSLVMAPAIRHDEKECVQCGRSVSAGHGDGQLTKSSKTSSRRAQGGKMDRPLWSAPAASRRRGEVAHGKQTEPWKSRKSEGTIATVVRNDKTLPTCKGDEVSVPEEKPCANSLPLNDSLKIDEDQMLIFSWKSENQWGKPKNPVLGNRSYTMLHWSDSSYTATPKRVLADVLKRVISSVSSYNLQPKSLGSFPAAKPICGAQPQASEVPDKEIKWRSSKSETLIQDNGTSEDKYNWQLQNEYFEPNEERNIEVNKHVNTQLSSNSNLPLFRKRLGNNYTKNEHLIPGTHAKENLNENREKINKANGRYRLPFPRKDHLARDVTHDEINMYVNYPILAEPKVYSWWHRRQKVFPKSTQQRLLESASSYAISSSEEEFDLISWRD